MEGKSWAMVKLGGRTNDGLRKAIVRRYQQHVKEEYCTSGNVRAKTSSVFRRYVELP